MLLKLFEITLKTFKYKYVELKLLIKFWLVSPAFANGICGPRHFDAESFGARIWRARVWCKFLE